MEKEITEEKKLYHPVKLLDNVQKAVMGSGNFAAITTDGTLLIWGRNDMGQLLDGTTEGQPGTKPCDGWGGRRECGRKRDVCRIEDRRDIVVLGRKRGQVRKRNQREFHRAGYGNGRREDGGHFWKPVFCCGENDGTLWTTGGDSWGALGNGTEGSTTEFVKIMDEVECVKLSDFSFAVKKGRKCLGLGI